MASSIQHGGSGLANGVASAPGAASTPNTPARPGRHRHARTNASLTSSSASTSADAPFPMDALSRRTSQPSDATRIFQTTGLDPFGTEPDTLFRSLPVKEVEAYERAVRHVAVSKQHELRALVGQRYQDLLGTANTIIDMAGSSQQLSERLEDLSKGFHSAADGNEKRDPPSKLARRKSFLPPQHAPMSQDSDGSDLHQEAVYVLGASLRLIMDVPEYVWKSIEKGKTLQASWAFLLARATWNDLTDAAPHAHSHSALMPDSEGGIASVSEAISMLKVNVRKLFPFIEKQWQSMQPMRKQIVHRAILLLSDVDIESAAVTDQLAALALLDGARFEHALQLLLSHRLTAMRRLLQRRRRRRKSTSHTKADRRTPAEKGRIVDDAGSEEVADRATQASHTIAQLATLFARTLQHAIQIFVLPPRADASSDSKPWLLGLLSTITNPIASKSGAKLASSPTRERTSLMPQHIDDRTSRQTAAAMRALRRKSSYGLPPSATDPSIDTKEPGDSSEPQQRLAARVSTADVIQALPSARVLLRLLPPSLQEFVPLIDLASRGTPSASQVADEISSWSAKVRESIAGGASHASADSLSSMLSELFDVRELAMVRRSLRLAMKRAQRIVSRKVGTLDASADESVQAAISKVHAEMQKFEADIASVLQARLLQVLEQKLSHAIADLLEQARATISSPKASFGSGGAADAMLSQPETPLDALFRPIEAQSTAVSTRTALDADDPANPIRTSRSYVSVLQDDLRGRSEKVDGLASLYETPYAAISGELRLYRAELDCDDRFAESSASIQASFDSLVASSRKDIETGLSDLLDQVEGKAKGADKCASRGHGHSLPPATSVVMQLIAVLATTDSQVQDGEPKILRPPVNAMLERYWRAPLEQSISNIFQRSIGSDDRENHDVSSVSTSMLQVLIMLSESIVELGPALAGPELASQVRQMLQGVAASRSDCADRGAVDDAATLTSLLKCEPAALADFVGADKRLDRVRLALSPVLLALAGSQGEAGSITTERVLSRAEPASAVGQVRPILSIPSKKKMERFSPLPVR